MTARRPATVLYALERAASSHDERYLRWLFEDAEPPGWFSDYRARRRSWQTSRASSDGHLDDYAACGYRAETIEALVDCAASLLSAEDLALARLALQRADALLGPRWLELQPVLLAARAELRALVEGGVGTEMAQLLLEAAQLSEQGPLAFEVVLVARPEGPLARAKQAGTFVVVELGSDLPVAGRVPVLFHELAHLAARRAPRRPELERALEGRGLPGLIAANLWDEAFATAFGNGLVARAFNPALPADRSLYEDAAVDALGKALLSSWRAGARPRLDASFAEQLLDALATSWPRERWRPADLLDRVVLFSDDREAASALRQGLRPSWLHQQVPLPAELPPRAAPSTAPQLIAATLDTLQRRPDAALWMGLEPREVALQVEAHGASLHWLASGAGVRLLIAAQGKAELREAARAFARWQRLPEPGWTPLRANAPSDASASAR